MKLLLVFPRWTLALMLGALMIAPAGAGAADAPKAAASSTNGPAAFVVAPPFVAPALPQSVFVQPRETAEGRDPFYPRSRRPYSKFDSGKQVVVPQPVADLTLKGISGSKEQPLAIINTTTFTSGEENDVLTKAGRMRIRCLEIKMDEGIVWVQVGGERRELRLAAK